MKKTVLFVCGCNPFKKTLLMPRMSWLTKDDVNARCGESLPPLPPLPQSLPQGQFDFVVSTESCQVFVFKHKRVSGCSNIASFPHRHLPPPINNCKSWKDITVEPEVHVGYSYMFGHDQPYSISNSKVLITDHVVVLDKFDMAVNRTVKMIIKLNSQVGNDYNIELLDGECSHYSPFKGGGDIIISKVDESTMATIQLSASSSASQPDPEISSSADLGSSPSPTPLSTDNITPPKKEEHGFGNVENEVSTSRSEEDVRLQLQANMMLVVAKSLKPLIKKFGENAGEKIRVMTCYGISFGGLYPLNVLKLTVDFDNQLCKYEEQLRMYPSAVYAAYIDIGISYILKRLTNVD